MRTVEDVALAPIKGDVVHLKTVSLRVCCMEKPFRAGAKPVLHVKDVRTGDSRWHYLKGWAGLVGRAVRVEVAQPDETVDANT